MRRLFCLALICLGTLSASAKDESGEACRVVIIGQSGRMDFVRELAKGAAQEAGAIDGSFEVVVPDKQPSNGKEQLQMLASSVQDGAGAILLTPFDRRLLADPVKELADKGFPIVVVDSGIEPQASFQLTADNREAGRLAAQRIGDLLEGRGKVILLRNQINAQNTEEREEGFLEIIETAFPGITLVATDFHAGPTLDSARRVSDTLLNTHSDVNAVFASSEAGTQGILQALRAKGLAGGKVKLIGINEGDESLAQALRQDVQGLLRPDGEAMGKAAMTAISCLKAGRTVDVVFSPQVAMVTPDGAAPKLAPQLSVSSPAPAPVHPAPLREGDFTIPGLDLTMLSVPPHGTTDAAALPPFWLGRYEVTQKQWTEVMGMNPSDFTGANRPVENVSWEDAMEFCRKLNERESSAGRLLKGYFYTLPTEIQWEYACHAGAAGPFEGRDPSSLGWYITNSGMVSPGGSVWRMSTHPVGEKAPNAWGFYDMHGNVSEWCLNPYDPAEAGGAAPVKYRVLRGGCWWTDVQNCQADSRHKAPADRRHGGLGFRLALSGPP